MKSLGEYPLTELKLVYQVLHAGIIDHPGLMDSELLQQLQKFLQEKASAENVDVSTHSEWSDWLDSQD